MSKKGQKAAAKAEHLKKLASSYTKFLNTPEDLRDSFGRDGFHRIRRLFQVHILKGEGLILERGFFRWLREEFAPNLMRDKQEAQEMLETINQALDPKSPGSGPLEQHIMELGREVSPEYHKSKPCQRKKTTTCSST